MKIENCIEYLVFIGNCGGNTGWIGDNYCDDINNNPECNYDSGDCCGPNVNTQWCQVCLCLEDNSTLPTTTGPSTPSTTYTTFTTENSTAGIAKHLSILF